DEYYKAKSQIFSHQDESDFAVVPANSERCIELASAGGGHVVTFGENGDCRVESGWIISPSGQQIVNTSDVPKGRPTDIANALAAVTISELSGADADSMGAVLRDFQGLPHRVEFVCEANGVRYFDDSKASTPDATMAAVDGFDSVILIAG